MRDFKQIVKGLRFKPNDGGSNPIGDLSGVLTAADNGAVYQYQNRLKAFLDAVEREIITNDQAQTITNKTIDADNNTISNIENDNIKAGAAIAESKLDLDYSTSSLNTAISDHIADATDAHDSSAISYNNATSGLTATDAQGAIDEVEGRLQTAEQDISNHIADTVDAHDASAISNVPSGNLAATDVQGALNELQSDIDTRALASDLSNHLSDSTDAHDASAISYINTTSGLTATDVQAAIDEVEGRLDTVETDAGAAQTDIDNHIADTTDAHDASAISNVPAGNLAATDVQGALNELQSDVDTRALNSDLTTHTSASTNVHGLSGGAAVVGTTSTQTLTNKTIQGASIESPTRLDVKKDTKANLETYATTATDGQLCFATDEKIMYQVVDNALTEVGSGSGVGSVDIMFADQFDSTAIADYTITGTVTLTEDVLEVLQGKKSLEILHTGGASAERPIPVDIKFRGKNVTLSLDVASNALSGNLTLTVTDETNTVTLINAESIQPQEAGQTSVKRSVSFNVPSDCEELKYKFTAVSESGKISFIDNVVIELTQTAKLDTTIEVPVMTDPVNAGTITLGAVTTAPTKGVMTTDSVSWYRSGKYAHITYRFHQSSTAGATAGSGEYLYSLPSGLVVDTSYVTPFTGAGLPSNKLAMIGQGQITSASGPTNGSTYAVLYDANRFRLYTYAFYSNGNYQSNTFYPLTQAEVGHSITIEVPILGWEATETQSVSLAQTVLVQESDSAIQLDGANGYGSTLNNKIARFSNQRMNLGDAITYFDDPVNGARFTVTKAGIYTINFNAAYNANTGSWHGISKNASSLITNLSSLPMSEVLTLNLLNDADSATNQTTASWSGYLQIGDVIRPHTHGQGQLLNAQWTFSMSYQGSLKQLNVSENQKIEIPTSELRMEGASTRGSTATAIVRFDNIAKLRGDAFTVESDATLGTRITMKKKGRLNISSCIRMNSAASSYITKNQTVLTSFLPTSPSEILSGNGSSAGANVANPCWLGDVEIGDVIRITAEAAPASAANNSLNLSFQEQEVSVSVTNVLPQFSESDSSVRVDTANGYGSTATLIRRFGATRENLDSSVLYVDDPVSGGRFEIKESGNYNISYTDNFNNISSAFLGISKNASSLTTSIASLTASERLASAHVPAIGATANCSWEGYLQQGDIIRAHVGTAHAATTNALTSFTISKVGKPNVTGVDVTPFAKIEYEVKDEVQANTHAGYGATNTRIPYYTNITKNTNRGLIRVENSATLGFSITVLKACELTIESTHVAGSNVAHGLTVNSAQLSTSIFSINPPERLTIAYTSFSDVNQSVLASYTGFFQAGDVIRPHTATAQAPGSTNRCNISVVATELRDAYQVIGGGVENTYSARITSAGAITTESYSFIDSITKGGTGIYNIVFKAGFFTQAPSVIPTVDTNAGNAAVAITSSITTSGCTISTVNVSDVLVDKPFNLQVTRQGSDYRTPSKAIGLPAQRIAYVQRFVAPATSGGTSVAGAWNTVPLSTVTDPSGIGISVASNQFILPAGTYDVSAFSSLRSGDGQVRIRNITDSTTLLVGSETYGSSAGDPGILNGLVEGRFTLAAQKTIELQYRVSVGAAYGLGGMVSNYGENVLTASVRIEKLEE